MPNSSTWTRRDTLGGALGLSSGLLIDAWIKDAHSQASNYNSHPLRGLAATLADIVIPQTDTPGAAAANVGGFVLFALERGMSGLSLELLERAHAMLAAMAGGDFMSVSGARQVQILTDLDRRAYESEKVDDKSAEHAWRRIKGAIVAGYYTSEVGATKELVNEPVPGRFANIELTTDFRSRSNDVQGGSL